MLVIDKGPNLGSLKLRNLPLRMPEGLFNGLKKGIGKVYESKVKRDLPRRDIIQISAFF